MKLLIAEDNVDISKALKAVLEKCGYSVDAVHDGLSALDHVSSGSYDALILDIMMPGCDGLEVLRRIRKDGSDLPVLMLTAKSEIDDRVKGLDAGADDYLPKPFAIPELLARVRAMLRRRSDFHPDIVSTPGVTLNRGMMELSHGGKSVRLVMREFQVMDMLMENRGRIVSADTIMEHIWGWDSEVEVNIVWVTVSNLRKKLASIGAGVRIDAVRGAGYRLEEIR